MTSGRSARPSSRDDGLHLWRIVARRYRGRAYDGEGARLHGGRWNHPGTPAAYASPHLSLATLELFVHLDPDVMPDDLVAVPARLPAEAAVETLPGSSLPGDWRVYPAPEAVQDLGTAWLRGATAVALLVPSVVLPEEHNVLLNPQHPDFARLTVDEARPFAFDPRMWK